MKFKRGLNSLLPRQFALGLLTLGMLSVILCGCGAKSEKPISEMPAPETSTSETSASETSESETPASETSALETSAETAALETSVLGGAASPEEAVEIFIHALAEQDVETMLACCYIEDYLERFSSEEYVNRLGMVTREITDSEYDYYKELAVYKRQGEFASQICSLAHSLLLSIDEWGDYETGFPVESYSGQATAFIDEANPEQLNSLQIASLDVVSPEGEIGERLKENYRKIYFSDDCVELTALLELNGSLFAKGFTLAGIEGRWKIASLSARYVGDSLPGIAVPVENATDYEKIIKD